MNKWSFRYKGIAKMGIVAYKGAIADMDQAIVLSLTFTAAYYSRGLLKMELGLTESGLLDSNKANEPGDTDIFEGINIYRN